MTKTELERAYTDTLRFTDNMIGEYGALETASVMSAIALSLYKTILPPEDFDLMVDAISDSRNQVKSFKPPGVLQ